MLHGVGRFVGVGEILEGYWFHGRLNGWGRWVLHNGYCNEGTYKVLVYFAQSNTRIATTKLFFQLIIRVLSLFHNFKFLKNYFNILFKDKKSSKQFFENFFFVS